jgi:hypothetical protein
VSCPQAPVILKANFSSSITSGGNNRAWEEIANIVNAGNSAKRDIKEIPKNGTIYVLPQKLRFLYIVGAKDKQVIDVLSTSICVQNNFSLAYSSNNTTFSLSVQFGFRLDIFYFQQSRIVTFKHTRP